MRFAGNKYGAKRTKIDGIWFDSKAEARRYSELKALERAGIISRLTVHPVFKIRVKQHHVCRVILDFLYYDRWGIKQTFEDVKGRDTAVSRLKRKLVEAEYGIKVSVIKSGRVRP